MARPDISDQVIHFTKGASDDDAFNCLRNILAERQLRGGAGNIKGAHKCVCFTEAPLEVLPRGFVNSAAYSRYSLFGIMFEKGWLFAKGGRPAIYQSDGEYAALPEHLRWRHVRYEPHADIPIDFMWEREWRIRVDELAFTPDVATVIVPDKRWCDALMAEHNASQDLEIDMLTCTMDRNVAEQYREAFPWKCISR